jgi:hypothetical protein
LPGIIEMIKGGDGHDMQYDWGEEERGKETARKAKT